MAWTPSTNPMGFRQPQTIPATPREIIVQLPQVWRIIARLFVMGGTIATLPFGLQASRQGHHAPRINPALDLPVASARRQFNPDSE